MSLPSVATPASTSLQYGATFPEPSATVASLPKRCPALRKAFSFIMTSRWAFGLSHKDPVDAAFFISPRGLPATFDALREATADTDLDAALDETRDAARDAEQETGSPEAKIGISMCG